MKHIKTYEQYSHSELTEEGLRSMAAGAALALSTLWSSPEATAQTKSPIGHEQTIKATKDSGAIESKGPNGETITTKIIQFSKENPGFNKIDTSGNISTPKIYSDYEHHMVKPVIGSAHEKGWKNGDGYIKFNYTTKASIKEIKLIQETSFVDNEGTNMIFYEIVIEEKEGSGTKTSKDIEFTIKQLKLDAVYHIKCGNDAIKFNVYEYYK